MEEDFTMPSNWRTCGNRLNPDERFISASGVTPRPASLSAGKCWNTQPSNLEATPKVSILQGRQILVLCALLALLALGILAGLLTLGNKYKSSEFATVARSDEKKRNQTPSEKDAFNLPLPGHPQGRQARSDPLIDELKRKIDDLNQKVDGLKRDVDELKRPALTPPNHIKVPPPEQAKKPPALPASPTVKVEVLLRLENFDVSIGRSFLAREEDVTLTIGDREVRLSVASKGARNDSEILALAEGEHPYCLRSHARAISYPESGGFLDAIALRLTGEGKGTVIVKEGTRLIFKREACRGRSYLAWLE